MMTQATNKDTNNLESTEIITKIPRCLKTAGRTQHKTLPSRVVAKEVVDQTPSRINQQKGSKKNKCKFQEDEIIRICLLNTLTLLGKEREIELDILEKLKWDVIELSKVRKMGEEMLVKENGSILCYKGETKGHHGVGFLVGYKWSKVINEFIGISERLAILKLQIAKQEIVILQVYAPTKKADQHTVDDSIIHSNKL